MPENKLFWSIFKTVGRVAKDQGLRLPHRAVHQVANAYMDTINNDPELNGHDPKTYSDPTGEAAIRDWLSRWITTDATAA